MKTIFTLGFALCTAVTSFAQGIAFYDGTWDEILAKAKKEHKMIFLDAYTSWCGPCKMLVNQTFPQPEVGIFFNSNFVNTHFDMEKGEGAILAGKYAVNMYPTLLVIDSTGKIVERTAGFLQAPGLIDFGKRALGRAENVPEWAAKYEGGDHSPETLRRYALALRRTAASSTKIANEYMATQKDMATPENRVFLLDALERIDSKIFDLIIADQKQFALLDGTDNLSKRIVNAAKNTTQIAAEFKSVELLRQAQKAVQKYTKGNAAKGFAIESDMNFYDKIGDETRFAKAAQDLASKILGNDAARLYALAKTFDGRNMKPENLKPALKWAKKAYDATPKYEIACTYASLALKLNDKKTAHTIAQKAIELATKEGVAPQLAQFLLEKSKS